MTRSFSRALPAHINMYVVILSACGALATSVHYNVDFYFLFTFLFIQSIIFYTNLQPNIDIFPVYTPTTNNK